ncbi:helix-turn-helix transcriptional regulator [Spirosoma areae]
MTINDKIKQILIDKNLTPSYFADEIGVQRSSISHILSGRNRPSFDIIQKIIRRFPELGYEWIMEEENSSSGQFFSPGYANRGAGRPVADRGDRSLPGQPSIPYPPQPATIRSQRHEIPPTALLPASSVDMGAPTTESALGSIADRRVERILIFYSDGSFREYTPAT